MKERMLIIFITFAVFVSSLIVPVSFADIGSDWHELYYVEYVAGRIPTYFKDILSYYGKVVGYADGKFLVVMSALNANKLYHRFEKNVSISIVPYRDRLKAVLKSYISNDMKLKMYDLQKKHVISQDIHITVSREHSAMYYENIVKNIVSTRFPDKVLLWAVSKPKITLSNDKAAAIISATPTAWNTYGITGEGEIIGVADTGLDTGNVSTMHPDLKRHVISIIDTYGDGDTSDVSGHGTHVVGSIVGDGTMSSGLIKGMAPSASVVFQAIEDNNTGNLSVPNDLGILFKQAYDKGARIHSDSWGVSVDDGGYVYDGFTASVDNYLWNTPEMTVLFASGNDGLNHPLRSINNPGTAKNVITVGASENNRPDKGSWADNINQVAEFSSRGPAPDCRVKPDVVAPGTWILSTKSSKAPDEAFWSVYNNYYAFMGGTSMATPIAAGAVALIREFVRKHGLSNPSSALIKALLIAGAYVNINLDHEDYSPSPAFGWGRVSLKEIFPSYEKGNLIWFDENHVPKMVTGATWTYTVNVRNFQEPLKVVLVWRDYPGSPLATKTLVNDLDLNVIDPLGNVIRSVTTQSYFREYCSDIAQQNKDADHVNNVEVVFVPHPMTGTYTIVVSGYNVPMGPQPFAIVAKGDFSSTTTLSENNPPVITTASLPTVVYDPHLIFMFTSTDDTRVYRNEVFLDGKLVLESWRDFSVNINLQEDGLHVMRLKTTDVFGNVSEKVFSVRVYSSRYHLTVKTLTATGAPLPNVYISAESPAMSVEGYTSTTGVITFSNMVTATYDIVARYNGLTATTRIHLTHDSTVTLVMGGKFLVVDDDGGRSVERYYIDMLDGMNVLYDVVSSNDVYNMDLNKYQGIIWIFGDNSNAADMFSIENKLREYLKKGGKLWIDGKNVLSSTYKDHVSFWKDLMGVYPIGRISGQNTIILDNEKETLADIDSLFTDVIGLSSQSQCLLTASISGVNFCVGAVNYPAYMAIYTSVGIEDITSLSKRDILVEYIKHYLQMPTYSYPSVSIASDSKGYYAIYSVGSVGGTLTIRSDDETIFSGFVVGQGSVGLDLRGGRNHLFAEFCGVRCSGWMHLGDIVYIDTATQITFSGLVRLASSPITASVYLKGEKYEQGYSVTAVDGEIPRIQIIPDVYKILVVSSSPTAYYTGTLSLMNDATMTFSLESGKPWTWMIYMAADNNLSNMASVDINELERGINTNLFNIIVLVDYKGDDNTYVYNIVHDASATIISPTVSIPGIGNEVDTGSITVLKKFVSYVRKHYHSKYYALTIWDHGLGWIDSFSTTSIDNQNIHIFPMGVAYDDTSHDHINVIQLAEALKEQHIDLLDFDACLMGNFEVAYELRNSADYIVFSEALVPGEGEPYDEELNRLVSNISLTPVEFASTLVDTYVSHYTWAVEKAVIDLKNIETLKLAWDKISLHLISMNINPSPLSVLSMFGGSMRYFADISSIVKMFLPRYMQKYFSRSLNKVVIYKKDNGITFSSGLSIEPYGYYGNDPFYMSLSLSRRGLWDEFLLSTATPNWLHEIRVNAYDDINDLSVPATVSLEGFSVDTTVTTDDVVYVRTGTLQLGIISPGYYYTDIMRYVNTSTVLQVSLHKYGYPFVDVSYGYNATLSKLNITASASDREKDLISITVLFDTSTVASRSYGGVSSASISVVYTLPSTITPGLHVLKVCAEDSNNHITCIDKNINIVVKRKITLYLHRGINLVSFPFTPTVAIGNILTLNGIDRKKVFVFAYEKGRFVKLNIDNNYFKVGVGYLIYSLKNYTMEITGFVPNTNIVRLASHDRKGIFLIGILNGMNTVSDIKLLDSKGKSYTIDNQRILIFSYEKGRFVKINSSSHVIAGRAYLIYSLVPVQYMTLKER